MTPPPTPPKRIRKPRFYVQGHKILDNGMLYPVVEFFDDKESAKEFIKREKLVDIEKWTKGGTA